MKYFEIKEEIIKIIKHFELNEGDGKIIYLDCVSGCTNINITQNFLNCTLKISECLNKNYATIKLNYHGIIPIFKFPQ